jgi:hypothetical protein
MPEANALSSALDVAAACSGFVGSFVLMVTAWCLAPVQQLLDEVGQVDPAGKGGKLVIAVTQKTISDVKKIRRWERPLMIVGAGLLVASFGCSIARHLI